MDIFNANQQNNLEINNLLQKIKYKIEHESFGKNSTFFPYITIRNNKPVYHESTRSLAIFKKLEDLDVIKIYKRDLDKMNKNLKENIKSINDSIIVEGFIITITKKFLHRCNEYERMVNKKYLNDKGQLSIQSILGSKKIKFNDAEAKIKIGNLFCQLPPFKNEHCLCRIMFQYLPEEPIDWSIIYEEMKEEITDKIKNKRSVQDTMYSLNKRIKEAINTNDDLFTWQEMTIKRNY